MAIFYSNFTVIVCFLVIFVIIIIKITKIIIIIIIETIIIIIKKKFGHTRKTSFLTSKKEDQVARIGVRGGGLGIRAMAERKRFFSVDPFPKPNIRWIPIANVLEAWFLGDSCLCSTDPQNTKNAIRQKIELKEKKVED